MEHNNSILFIQHSVDVTLVTFNDTEILEEGSVSGEKR